MKRIRNIIAVVASIALLGCASFGPQTIPRDRFNYADAISNSW